MMILAQQHQKVAEPTPKSDKYMRFYAGSFHVKSPNFEKCPRVTSSSSIKQGG